MSTDNYAGTGHKPARNVQLHALNTTLSPNSAQMVACDNDGKLLVAVPDAVDVNVLTDPVNVNISSQDSPLDIVDLDQATSATTTTPNATATSSIVLAANANRKGALISNAGPTTVFINFGATAAITHHPLLANTALRMGRETFSVHAITASGTQALAVSEFT